jgi:hypothetical protein
LKIAVFVEFGAPRWVFPQSFGEFCRTIHIRFDAQLFIKAANFFFLTNTVSMPSNP